jgi:hypothetical protein
MKKNTTIGRVVGAGLLAGFTGTALMTAVQRIQMRLANRPPSKVPAKAIEKLLNIEAKDERTELRLATATHWSYGSGWGLIRAVVRELGLAPAGATLAQLALLWGTELTLLPRLKVAPPLGMWTRKEIAQDLLFHGLYATATGVAYDALRSDRATRRAGRLLRSSRRLRRQLRMAPRALRGVLPAFS